MNGKFSKLILFIVVLGIMLASCVSASAEPKGEIMTNIVRVSGKLENLSSDDVTVALIKKTTNLDEPVADDIGYITQIKPDSEGQYSAKFKFTKNVSDYMLYVRQGQNDVTKSVELAVAEKETITACTNIMGDTTGEFDYKISVSTQNDWSDYLIEEYKATLIVTELNDGRLISAKSYNVNVSPDAVPVIGVNVSDDATEIRAFLWEDFKTLIPLAEASALSVGKVKFDTERLFSTVPQIYEAEEQYNVANMRAIYYDGEPYKGNPTRVFAYLGMPEVAEGEKVPAVVIMHGHGGTAEPTAVEYWVSKGYAALSMDHWAHTPDGQLHKFSGPEYDEFSKTFTEKLEDQWTYHAATSAILANNVLRSLPEVDASKIGITGNSLGGFMTSLVSGIDNRFAFAVPVYGCGYLYESAPYWSSRIMASKNIWDPSLYIKDAEMPILWLSSDHDEHFWFTTLTKSYEVQSDNSKSNLCVKRNFEHGMAGFYQEEMVAFADSIVNQGKGLVKITDVRRTGNSAVITMDIPEGVDVSRVVVYTNNDSELKFPLHSSHVGTFVGTWNENAVSYTDGNTATFEIPDEAQMMYATVTDNRGMITSTGLIELNK